ncbi:hypothetical protein TTHERM_00655980 (macronuclear) [Tetrahymena thermophila SB210]|uniref:Kinase domain protein n=1 Tax=Tetrahymena thermophila (strain SB210) TaxID=312017 RepID=Q22GV8_TETTS|nr:hypothetical protein TTHERM_00655980 [Tetrahymena thermophila SB210]EAR84566.2 hypothetical protein TTHERM_00655980 [Tetrahymena thermophila SB210]|eukprot:XP_001032229.2 hypothetical protein TTHERM_00655980 [Tetrahymena thermophila SB210]
MQLLIAALNLFLIDKLNLLYLEKNSNKDCLKMEIESLKQYILDQQKIKQLFLHENQKQIIQFEKLSNLKYLYKIDNEIFFLAQQVYNSTIIKVIKNDQKTVCELRNQSTNQNENLIYIQQLSFIQYLKNLTSYTFGEIDEKHNLLLVNKIIVNNENQDAFEENMKKIETCQNMQSLHFIYKGIRCTKNIEFFLLAQQVQKFEKLLDLFLDFEFNTIEKNNQKQNTNQEKQNLFYLLQQLPKCRNLHSLSCIFNNCRLNQERGINFVTDQISQCQSLAYLSISFWKEMIDAQGIYEAMQNISKMKQLTYLNINLQGNQIGDEGTIKMGWQISRLINLRQLKIDLWGNNIKSDGVSGFASEIQKCSQIILLELNLRYNNINSNGVIGLANEIQNYLNLRNLSLLLKDNDQISKEALSILGQRISKCSQMHSLTLDKRVTKQNNTYKMIQKSRKSPRLVSLKLKFS